MVEEFSASWAGKRGGGRVLSLKKRDPEKETRGAAYDSPVLIVLIIYNRVTWEIFGSPKQSPESTLSLKNTKITENL